MAQGYNRARAQSASDYVLEKAIITSSAFIDGEEIDIRNVITDIEIFETLDKPYLTGNVVLMDDNNLYNTINFSGAERLSLEFTLPGGETAPISKTFVIHKTIKNIRANDRTTAVAFRLIEDHAFDSLLTNVNKSYSGKPTEIIQNIIRDNLNKEFKSDVIKEDAQRPMKVIIPNLTPLKAAHWVAKRATTRDGIPYYFFSTLGNDHLHIIALDEILQTNPDPKPYTFSQISTAYSASSSVDDQAYNIQSYTSKATDDISDLVMKGMIGADYGFYDPTVGRLVGDKRTHFSIEEELLKLLNNDVISQRQNNLTYTGGYEKDGVSYAELNSRVITEVNPSATFYQQGLQSYNEDLLISDHKKRIVAVALKDILTRNPIEISLPGRNFLVGEYSNTVGNQITCRFLNTAQIPGETDSLDKKKSGDYIIYSIKHIFKRERYDVMASCVKLGDLPEES